MLAVRRRERLTVPELAVRFGVSERTVFRAVQRERELGGERASGGVGGGAGLGWVNINLAHCREVLPEAPLL